MIVHLLKAIVLLAANLADPREQFLALLDQRLPTHPVIEARFDPDASKGRFGKCLVGLDPSGAFYRISSGNVLGVTPDGTRFEGREEQDLRVTGPARPGDIQSLSPMLPIIWLHRAKHATNAITNVEFLSAGGFKVTMEFPAEIPKGLPPESIARFPTRSVVNFETDADFRVVAVEHEGGGTVHYTYAPGALVPSSNDFYDIHSSDVRTFPTSDPAKFSVAAVHEIALHARTDPNSESADRAAAQLAAGKGQAATLSKSQAALVESGGSAAWRLPLIGLGIILVGLGAFAWIRRRA